MHRRYRHHFESSNGRRHETRHRARRGPRRWQNAQRRRRRAASVNRMVSAIIVAAGSSRRMGFDKLFAPLAGKPVLWHSLKAFNDCKDVDEILVVTRADQMDEVEHLVS